MFFSLYILTIPTFYSSWLAVFGEGLGMLGGFAIPAESCSLIFKAPTAVYDAWVHKVRHLVAV